MNTKKLFMLLAAVLLGSVSAFAQSGNNEPLRGDVNEDGTVDVADIVNVIKILKDAGGTVGEKMCYWYAGTNNGHAVTADNFTDVASRIPESEIPETGSVTANGQYVYFVMPESRHLESLTYANGSAVEFTCTDVMGYHIYKTSEMINTTINYTIKQTTYYWYVGNDIQNDNVTITETSGSNPGWRKITGAVNQYTPSNPLWNGSSNPIDTGFTTNGCYLYLPKTYVDAGLGVYTGDGTAVLDNLYQKTSRQTITIDTIVYYEYFKSGVNAQYDSLIYKK